MAARGKPPRSRPALSCPVMAKASRLLQAPGAVLMANSDTQRVVQASLGERLAARVIDVAIAYGPVLVGTLCTWRSPAFLPTYLLGLLYAFVYQLLADGVGAGQSVGKRLLGVIAIDVETRKPCSLAQSLLRNACLGLGVLDLVYILGGGTLRLGDKLAHTVVVLAPGRGARSAALRARPLARRWLRS